MPEYFILQEGDFVGKPPSFDSLEKAVDGYFLGIRPSANYKKSSQKPRMLAKKLDVKFASSNEEDDKICLEFPKNVSKTTPVFLVQQYQKYVEIGDYDGRTEDVYRIKLFISLEDALDSLKTLPEGKITLAKALDFKGVVSER